MQVIQTIDVLRKAVKQIQQAERTIGFVPTMGYLHKGHLSLVTKARQQNDIVVVSLFVNPTQFSPDEDFKTYPRDTERDIALLKKEDTDIVFMPAHDALYPEGYTTFVQVEGPMAQTLCGRSRPTHFRGVITIVTKLFLLVTPDRAYFGQKDAQQVALIQRMVDDLNFDIQIVICPIVREPDGLAMSSRNTYLTPSQRKDALILSKALFEAQEMIVEGERSAAIIVRHVTKRITSVTRAVIDYVSVVDARTLEKLEILSGDVLIAGAMKLGRTRLMDNIRCEV